MLEIRHPVKFFGLLVAVDDASFSVQEPAREREGMRGRPRRRR
jgi:hypothetical protein